MKTVANFSSQASFSVKVPSSTEAIAFVAFHYGAAWLAVSINKQHFWERYVKTVAFLASISLMLWLLSILQINIWDQITPEINSLMSYRVYSDSIRYQEYSFKLHGMFLYSHRTVDMRNVSIFTEPGIYQMVLNTAIFVFVFTG